MNALCGDEGAGEGLMPAVPTTRLPAMRVSVLPTDRFRMSASVTSTGLPSVGVAMAAVAAVGVSFTARLTVNARCFPLFDLVGVLKGVVLKGTGVDKLAEDHGVSEHALVKGVDEFTDIFVSPQIPVLVHVDFFVHRQVAEHHHQVLQQ